MITYLQDFSHYDGTTESLPAQTNYIFPSYFVFSDGIYPNKYPAHPNPPPPLPTITSAMNKARQFPLSRHDLGTANKDILLKNNQRKPIDVDFRRIVDRIRDIKW